MATKDLFVSNVTLISGKDGCCWDNRILKLAGYESVEDYPYRQFEVPMRHAKVPH